MIVPDFDALVRGGIVGVARITDCLKRSDSPWHDRGAWGFKVEGARRLRFTPRKGALGFFDVPWRPKKARRPLALIVAGILPRDIAALRMIQPG